MSPISSIALTPLSASEQSKITQLYRYLELFSEGTPARHSLFVFAPAAGPIGVGSSAPQDSQLLIVDPPADLGERFRLGSQSAALFTSAPIPTPVPIVATQPDGIAHLRIGDHFLDIYSYRTGAVVHLPAVGVICGGTFGSNSVVPRLGANSDGGDELDTLRLLARLVKLRRFSLYIPSIGDSTDDSVVVMERLAADVAYLHALRREITPLALRGESAEAISDVAESVLPRDRRTPAALAIHNGNVDILANTAP